MLKKTKNYRTKRTKQNWGTDFTCKGKCNKKIDILILRQKIIVQPLYEQDKPHFEK